MDAVDVKYINLISIRFQKFKKIRPNLYNLRCPICGDSKKNQNRTRGYFYQVKNNTNYKCHNCGINISFNNFLKQLDSQLHKEYIFEKFKNGHTGKNFVVEKPEIKHDTPVFKEKLDLPRASEIPQAHEYLTNRGLDSKLFYYAPEFKKWTNTLKFTFPDINYDEPRIIIPLYYQKKVVGFQGRSLGSNSVKYITIMLHEDAPKIYGLDDIQKDKTVYITEGPFDSTFISNSIALCGADGDVGRWGINNRVWIYDNEPRNSEITTRISNCIERGEKVVIWPSNIQEKDINDIHCAGHDVQAVIESNIYSDLEAKLKFTNWKKL